MRWRYAVLEMTGVVVGVATWLQDPIGGGQVGQGEAVAPADGACGVNGDTLCKWVYDATGNQVAADAATWFVGKPFRILVILIVAVVVNRMLGRTIQKLGDRIGRAAGDPDGGTERLLSEQAMARAGQRAETLTAVLRSVAGLIVYTFAVLMIIAELGISIGPLIAGAGIAGVALGFGAQSLVKDFLTGFFLLLEDQFGVGDVVDLGEAIGTVEKVTLRITTVRDINGTLWHVPNGEILRVANKSQLWARAVLDIGVGYDADIDHAMAVIKDCADSMWHDEAWDDMLQEEPEVLGVQDLAADAVTVRVTIKTAPAQQFPVERELRARLKAALDAADIEIPFTQRTVWLRHDDPPPDGASG